MQNSENLSFWARFFDYEDKITNRFLRSFAPRYSRIWGQKTAVWVDTGEAFDLYLTIPELRAVINKRASMMSSNIPKLINVETGEPVENHWLIDLIKKPNALQSWADCVYSISVNDALYSNAFAYSPKRSFGLRTIFMPLPSDKVTILTTGKKLNQIEKDGVIAGFEFEHGTDKEPLKWDDVVYFQTPDGLNIIKPSSRLDSLKYPLSNIKASYHKRNVLLENIGAIGILSAKNSDIGGAIPMSPEEKDEIQKSWYARSKDDLIITEADVNWQAMSFPTKDLMLFEELTADKLAIVDAYGLNSYIFSQEKGATFSNVRDGIRMAYNDTIIPETQQIYDTITEQFGLDKDGLRLVADFSHLAVLQGDELLKANAFNRTADAIKKLYDAGQPLTTEQVNELLGL